MSRVALDVGVAEELVDLCDLVVTLCDDCDAPSERRLRHFEIALHRATAYSSGTGEVRADAVRLRARLERALR